MILTSIVYRYICGHFKACVWHSFYIHILDFCGIAGRIFVCLSLFGSTLFV